jgi:hypothetical protein
VEYDKTNFLGVKPNGGGGDQHLALAGMLLTDAARRNSFNYANVAPGRLRLAAAPRIAGRTPARSIKEVDVGPIRA